MSSRIEHQTRNEKNITKKKVLPLCEGECAEDEGQALSSFSIVVKKVMSYQNREQDMTNFRIEMSNVN